MKPKFKIPIVIATTAVVLLLIISLVSCTTAEPNQADGSDFGEAISELLSGAADNVELSDAPQEDEEPIADEETGVEDDSIEIDSEVSSPSSDGATVSTQSSQAKAASSNNSSSTPKAPPIQSSPQKKWVQDTEQIWVEDKSAWSEQVPIYGTKEVSICNICGEGITGNTSAHGKAHMLAGEGSGHHSETRQTIIGYDTVKHDAIGHYETHVTGGHWE